MTFPTHTTLRFYPIHGDSYTAVYVSPTEVQQIHPSPMLFASVSDWLDTLPEGADLYSLTYQERQKYEVTSEEYAHLFDLLE